MNFINVLEKMSGIIAQYEERTAKLKAIVAKMWGKEEELRSLKSELATLDCKITTALAPKRNGQDGEENNNCACILSIRDDLLKIVPG